MFAAGNQPGRAMAVTTHGCQALIAAGILPLDCRRNDVLFWVMWPATGMMVAGGLTALVEAPYDTEDILQALLARHHDLLPGDQIDPENPRRWLLVTREMGVSLCTCTLKAWAHPSTSGALVIDGRGAGLPEPSFR